MADFQSKQSTEKTFDQHQPEADVDEGRRAALQKLGIYGAYTAPALLGLFSSTKAAHASSVCPPVC